MKFQLGCLPWNKGLRGIHISSSARGKMRLSQLGRKHPQSVKDKISKANAGRVFTKEHIEKIKMSAQGRVISEDTRKKMSESRLGNKNTLGFRPTESTRKKMRLAHLGSKNPNWEGGVSLINKGLMACLRVTMQYYKWRGEIFNRDKFECQWCGDSSGGNLNAHHINPIKFLFREYKITTMEQALNCGELWNLNNGVALCGNCHSIVHKQSTWD